MSEQPFNQIRETRVCAGPEAAARLRELGVSQGRLDEALDAGDVAARQATIFSPVNAAGMYRWLETVTRLRTGLAADGWQAKDPNNSPRIVHPSGRTVIVAASGNARTGLDDGDPRTARARGTTSFRSVQLNAEQLELNLGLAAVIHDMSAETGTSELMWFLLYHRTEDELRAELSLPFRMSVKGHVDSWRERILLPSRTFDSGLVRPLDVLDDGGTDVAFDVVARG